MTTFAQALSSGATLRAPDRTQFRLWAPKQDTVALRVEGGADIPMQRGPGGWFEAEAAVGAGTAYRYALGSGLVVPDPTSRMQADDVHGPSVVVDPRSYRWRNTTWRGRPWHETVLYELHAGLLGGFAGVQRELPRLAALGITAVELMPVNDFPGSRNWGYDGVLPFAPDRAYGTPDDLKALIDAAHELGLMVFLDVVYNHFGPDGNYLASYAEMFRDDVATPWGAAIDFRKSEVRRFFAENALYWLMEYRFDGLRFDAVHAIPEPDWLDEMAAQVRAAVEPGRHVHLALEHDGNVAAHLRGNFDAQWNDDAHHVLHVMLTGESEGYYGAYADRPAARLARCLGEGFAYQGEPFRFRGGEPRGTPSGDLPPTAFVLFLQNHDQIGNRAFGERLTTLADRHALEAAIALQLLCPHIPLLFMGEETASLSPYRFFTDHHGALADIVREGRRREFASFAAFSDPARRESIPDPNAPETFEGSRPQPDPAHGDARAALYRRLLALRHDLIVPHLAGAKALGADAIGPAAVMARWRLGQGAVLTLASNLGVEPCVLARPAGEMFFATSNGAWEDVRLAGTSTVAWLEPSHG